MRDGHCTLIRKDKAYHYIVQVVGIQTGCRTECCIKNRCRREDVCRMTERRVDMHILHMYLAHTKDI